LLRQALASIRALQGPDLTFEILVGDNGVAPETSAVAKEFDAIYLKAAVRGPSAARNVCMRAATGAYLAFLDDDDVWLPDNVRPHITQLELNPGVDALVGQVVYADRNLVPTGAPWPAEAPRDGKELLRRMLSGYFPQIGTVVARTAVRSTIGEFDEALIGGEDLDWLLRLARKRRLGFVSTPCNLVRGRPLGSFDSLQRIRIGYDRRVFFRHALPEWRIWRSPLDFSKAYSGTLMHFYNYFVDAAVLRAERGERREALRAIATALGVFPLRGAYHLVARRALRKAFWISVVRQRSPSERAKPGVTD
jgi:glycosyltransferase involved in cell wall biosynthesis